MKILKLHPAAIMPTKGTPFSAAFDLYMPEPGTADGLAVTVGLGIATEVPIGHVAILTVRSSTGAKHGLELNNTIGIIDADYRGEWKASLRTKSGIRFKWEAGDRLLQFLIVPLTHVELIEVDSLEDSVRGTGGFGSTGKN